MAAPTASCRIDVVEERVYIDRVAAVLGGDNWSRAFYTDVYVEKDSGTAFLWPAPFRSQWATSTSGINARLGKSAFTLTSASWNEELRSDLPGDYVLDLIGANEPVITIADYAANTGFWLSWYVFGDGDDETAPMRCGWSTETDGSDGVWLSMTANGKVLVYKDGTDVDHLRAVDSFYGQDFERSTITKRWVSICLIPGFRRNELLGITSLGGVFSVKFEELAEEEGVEVVPETKFWFSVPEGKAYVQVAEIKYPPAGYRCSTSVFWADEPTAGQLALRQDDVFADLNGGTATLSVVQRTAVGSAYVGGLEARLRVDITDSGGPVPTFVYGAQTEYPREVANTSNEAFELLPYLTAADISVPEDDSGVEMGLMLKGKADGDVLSEELDQIGTTQNRSLTFLVDGVAIFPVGRTQEPETSTHWNDEAVSFGVAVRGPWAVLGNYRYREPKVWDGANFTGDFLPDLLNDVFGSSVTVNIQSDAFNIPSLPQADGRFNMQADRGELASSVLRKAFEVYAGNWLYTFRPIGGGWEFCAGEEAHFGLGPHAELYWSSAAAQAVLGAAPAWRSFVYRDFVLKPLPIEANYVRLTGRDLRTGLPIEAFKSDYAAQDPTTARADRPENWTGDFRPLGVANPNITTLDAAERGVELLFDRVTPARFLGQWSSQLLRKSGGDPIWKGDVVNLDEHGSFRIVAFHGDLHKVIPVGEEEDDRYSLPGTYTGLKLLS